jgi:hypothetical protein
MISGQLLPVPLVHQIVSLRFSVRAGDEVPHPYDESRPIRQNYRFLGLCPSSGILKTREHNVSETGCVSVLRWEKRHLLF